MKRFRVTARSLQYDIVIGQGAWRALRELNGRGYSSVFIVTEEALWKRWGKKFLRDSGLRNARTLFVPAGEGFRNLIGRSEARRCYPYSKSSPKPIRPGLET